MRIVHTFKNKKLNILIAAVVIAGLVGLGIFIFFNMTKAPDFDVSGHTLTVKGTFSEDIPLEGAEVSLASETLEITYKVNGSATGKRCKGTFRVAGIEGNVYLNLMDKNAEYIRIVNNGLYFFINEDSEQETEQLYQDIINR